MKSKIKKMQTILMKGIATIALVPMFLTMPIAYATSSLDDSYLQASLSDKLLYGTIGSTKREIEKYLVSHTTLFIKNETQLRAFAEYVNDGHNCSGKEIILLNDIEVDKDVEWVPIGKENTLFSGKFIGNNYTISGIRINKDENDTINDVSKIGFFGSVDGAQIENLKLKNIKINTKDGSYVGGLVGMIKNGQVLSCTINDGITERVEDMITGKENVGGLIGYAENTNVDYCSLNAYILNDYSSMQDVGGLIGYAKKCNISNSKFSGGMQLAASYVGGIVGTGHDVNISNCINDGTINATSNVGGIIAEITSFDSKNTITIDKCTNQKELTTENGEVGGIVGIISSNVTCEIKNSKNIAKIKNYNLENVDASAGGIVGLTKGKKISIINCYNASKEIEADNNGIIGGIVGSSLITEKGSVIDRYKSEITPIGKNNGDNIEIKKYDVNEDGAIDDKDEILGSLENEKEIGANIVKDSLITSKLGNTTVAYEIRKNGTVVKSSEYFKAGNTITIRATFDKYLAKTYGPLEKIDDDTLKLKINDNIELTGQVSASSTSYTTTITYSYTIKDGDNFEIETLNLYKNGTIYEISGGDFATNHPAITETSCSANVTGYIVDTQKPTVSANVYVDNALKTGRYTVGKEVIIELTSSERINDYNSWIELQVNFSESGIGKYNYLKEKGQDGFAKLVQSKINPDGTTTWLYTYQIQEGDEGNLDFSFEKGSIEDMAGNITNIKEQFSPGNTISEAVRGSGELNNDLNVTYKFYKNSDSNEIQRTTDLKNEDKLIVIATFDKVLYVHYGTSDGRNTNIRLNNTNKDRAPSLYLNGDKNLKNTSVDEIKVDDNSTTIKYSFDISTYSLKELTKISKVVLKNENNDEQITFNGTTVATNGLIPFAEEWYDTYKNEDEEKYNKSLTANKLKTTTDIQNIVIDPFGIKSNIKIDDIYADTTAPVVTIELFNNNKVDYAKEYDINEDGVLDIKDLLLVIKYNAEKLEVNSKEWKQVEAKGDVNGDKKIDSNDSILIARKILCDENEIVNNITNEDTNVFKIRFSEELQRDLTKEDITVNNGYVEDIEKLNECEYLVTVKNNIATGNVGELILTIEKGTFKDLVGHENVRTEKIIRIDKKAPLLLSLEAYSTSEILLDTTVSNVKEKYRTGDKITVIATFDENITGLPKLTLQFSESGDAKGEITGTLEGNKITYTYTITDEDEGTLSVKGFSGTVTDEAGNVTIVTKRTLDGDTIIADSKAPEITGISVIAPEFEYGNLLEAHKEKGETKRYGIGKEINFVVSFNENIYKLDEKTITKLDKDSAPKLNFKFGNEQKEAEFVEVTKNEIHYKYIIKEGDNGDLSIVSLVGNLYDEAGNKTTMATSSKLPEDTKYEGKLLKENIVEKITADTKKPEFKVVTEGINYDDNKNVITGTGENYRKGGVITITVTTNEFVYKNTEDRKLEDFTKEISGNLISLKFGGSYARGSVECKDVNYDTQNSTTFVYEYEIKDGDNGRLSIKISEVSDIALNKNAISTDEELNIVADTINPTYMDNNGDIKYAYNAYTVTFNEKLYSLDDNNNLISAIAPILKFEQDETEYKGNVNGNVITYSGKEINHKPYLSGSSKLCDKAGNLYAYYDNIAPTIQKIEVKSPDTGLYSAGKEITILVTYSEKIKGTAPTLTIVFGDGETRTITANSEAINDNTIEYKYTIQKGDNGELAIVDYNGTELTDLSGNKWVKPENLPNLTGNKITADTIAPKLTITSDVERTNKEKVTYTFKWDEPVREFDETKVEVINGIKSEWKKISGSEYKLVVDMENEGRQVIRVGAKACKDLAIDGNENEEGATYNKVFIDCTKPIIRAKVNGGNYVIATDSNKSTLVENIVVNEELSKFEYVWSTSKTLPETGWNQADVSGLIVNSDITIKTEANEESTYYLYLRLTDLAGNILETRTNGFNVAKEEISLSVSARELTNQDVTVNVTYGTNLTENRKAGVSGKTSSADVTKVIVPENGTVYAEATDKAGNKVYKTLEITNIDKVAPEATIDYTTSEDGSVTAKISFNEENVIITNNSGNDTYKFTENGEFTFEFKDKAGNTGKATASVTNIEEKDITAPMVMFRYTLTTVTVDEPLGATILTDEDAKIEYKWDNEDWVSTTDYVRSQNASKKTNSIGKHILYAKATDKSGNTSEVQKLEFNVVKKATSSEIIFENLTTVQVNGNKYVKIPNTLLPNNLTEQMDKTALGDKVPEYKNLTDDGRLKTGSEITLDGNTQYIVVVIGDVNCDGDVSPIDVTMANSIRLGKATASDIQILAADFDSDNSVKPIDITMINSYRLGKITISI